MSDLFTYGPFCETAAVLKPVSGAGHEHGDKQPQSAHSSLDNQFEDWPMVVDLTKLISGV